MRGVRTQREDMRARLEELSYDYKRRKELRKRILWIFNRIIQHLLKYGQSSFQYAVG